MNLSTGMHVPIHSYKHDQTLHRIWKEAVILHVDDDVLVTANNRTRVFESDGRSWQTREPAICYFYAHRWFNVIGMFKKGGIEHYCNLSSPYLYDGEAIKYIDYDLDFKVYSDGTFQLLDEREYRMNMSRMDYPDSVKRIIQRQTEELKAMIIARQGPFDTSLLKKDFDLYRSLRRK